MANFTLKPPDSLVGGREVVLQLLEYGAGMFGQVRQLPQGPRQSHITDGDQILEKQALLVWDLIPAEQLRFHYSFGKRHVGLDRSINPTKVAQKWAKSSSLPSTPAPVSANSAAAAAAASASAPHPFICSRGLWCSWLLRRVICCPGRCCGVSPPLQAPNWRWFLKNGGGEILEQISSRLDQDCRSSSAPRAYAAGKSTIKTINITIIIYCNKYLNIISQILIRSVMCLKLLSLFLFRNLKRTETWNFPPLITCYTLYCILKLCFLNKIMKRIT